MSDWDVESPPLLLGVVVGGGVVDDGVVVGLGV